MTKNKKVISTFMVFIGYIFVLYNIPTILYRLKLNNILIQYCLTGLKVSLFLIVLLWFSEYIYPKIKELGNKQIENTAHTDEGEK